MPWDRDDLSIGGFGQPAQNVDATGRRIRDNTPPVPQRKPEAILPTPRGNELLNLIGKLESSDNYNVIYGGEEKPLTKMAVKEIQKLQKDMNTKGMASTAVGRYQIIDDKMNDLIRWMEVDENSLFEEKLQDQMGRQLLERRGFEKFKAGKIRTEDFIRELSQEWAALPVDESNESYYKGIGNNKALIDFKALKDMLEKE